MNESCACELIWHGAEAQDAGIEASPVDIFLSTEIDFNEPAPIDAAVAGIVGEIDAQFNRGRPPRSFPAAAVADVNNIVSSRD